MKVGKMGSSPRVRGEEGRCEEEEADVGIIPAGAGRRGTGQGLRPADGDHPRGCGEKRSRMLLMEMSRGSSPRVRGEARMTQRTIASSGIIPAGAGRSGHETLLLGDDGDHPRGCGEKRRGRKWARRRWGSSPRVRGEVVDNQHHFDGLGIIPAGAGRRRVLGVFLVVHGDHPRGCGEKSTISMASLMRRGSSPRVRGEEARYPGPHRPRGIIPAGAGRRSPSRCPGRARRDHPRGCGEKCDLYPELKGKEGSSPRVRGEGAPTPPATTSSGIIPAGAGRSGSFKRAASSARDHPRGCGEKVYLPLLRGRKQGSSPRVRGEGWKML